MTTKHNARVAQANLHVTRQRLATAMTQKRAFEARQRVLQERVRVARSLPQAPVGAAPAEVATEAPASTPVPEDEAPSDQAK